MSQLQCIIVTSWAAAASSSCSSRLAVDVVYLSASLVRCSFICIGDLKATDSWLHCFHPQWEKKMKVKEPPPWSSCVVGGGRKSLFCSYCYARQATRRQITWRQICNVMSPSGGDGVYQFTISERRVMQRRYFLICTMPSNIVCLVSGLGRAAGMNELWVLLFGNSSSLHSFLSLSGRSSWNYNSSLSEFN